MCVMKSLPVVSISSYLLCASGAWLLGRYSGAPRPRALRAPTPFPFSPTRKNCLFSLFFLTKGQVVAHCGVVTLGISLARANQSSVYRGESV